MPKNPKQLTVTKRPFLDPKNKSEIPVFIFLPFLLFAQQKIQTIAITLFLQCLSKVEQFFSKIQTQKRDIWRKRFLHPIAKREKKGAIFRKLSDNCSRAKNTNL